MNAAEGVDVKHSQVVNVDLLNIQNIRESVDREDDESLEDKSHASDENGEREPLDEDAEEEIPAKELLWQMLLK